MAKTSDNLKAAFAGESQANRKYTAFARKADEDGFHQVARLFRAAAAAETVQADNGVQSTTENLKEAIKGENFEVVSMYPPYIEEAKQEGDKKALTSFSWAWEVEKIHEALYRKALETLEKPAEEFDYYICPVCGSTHERNAPEKCPICGTPGKRFEKIS
jgi:rubrerythrin